MFSLEVIENGGMGVCVWSCETVRIDVVINVSVCGVASSSGVVVVSSRVVYFSLSVW